MPSTFSLSDYHGINRLLVVFAASDKDPAYREQCNQMAAEADGFAERDLLFICLFEEGMSGIRTPGGFGGEPKEEQTIPQEAASPLWTQFDVPLGAFAVILIGKDGTEKRRNQAPIKPESLYADIDVMPMRQRELRARGE